MSDTLFNREKDTVIKVLDQDNVGKTYAEVTTKHLTFECKLVDGETFVVQRVPDSTLNLHTFAIPYNLLNLDDLILTYHEHVSGENTCCMCSGSDSTKQYAAYDQVDSTKSRIFHTSCAEKYNETLRKFIEEVEVHKPEIMQNVVANKI